MSGFDGEQWQQEREGKEGNCPLNIEAGGAQPTQKSVSYSCILYTYALTRAAQSWLTHSRTVSSNCNDFYLVRGNLSQRDRPHL